MLLPLHIDRSIFSFQKLLKVLPPTVTDAALHQAVTASAATAVTAAATNRLHLWWMFHKRQCFIDSNICQQLFTPEKKEGRKVPENKWPGEQVGISITSDLHNVWEESWRRNWLNKKCSCWSIGNETCAITKPIRSSYDQAMKLITFVIDLVCYGITPHSECQNVFMERELKLCTIWLMTNNE